MTNPSDERISALVDGEMDEQERELAVDELLNQDDKREAWARYHLIGDTLKRSLPMGMDHGFSSRVMAALDNEPTVLAPPPRTSSWGQRAAGLAVAASVAAVAVLGVQFMYQQDGQTPTQQIAQAPAKLSPQQNMARANLQRTFQPSLRANIQTVTQTSGISNRIPQRTQRLHPRLNKYLVDHNQQTSRGAVQAIIPYARIVAYPNSRHTLIQAQK